LEKKSLLRASGTRTRSWELLLLLAVITHTPCSMLPLLYASESLARGAKKQKPEKAKSILFEYG
jgi:hypothetical protein